MSLYSVSVQSFLGSDTRIKVAKQGNPRKEAYLDRNSKSETEGKNSTNGCQEKDTRTARRKNLRHSRLSPYAKASMQRVSGAVDARHSHEQSIFLTGTFPGDSFAVQSAIARESGWIVHRLKAWIYKQIGANVAYYVWEFQRRGTLHLHYVVLVPDPIKRAAIIAGFRAEWIRLIQGASERSGANLFVGRRDRNFFYEKEKLQVYAQECYKSAGSYLAKYLGKHKYSDFPPPTRMWGCTREARNLVASSLISIEYLSQSLRKSEEIAYKLESDSDTPPDKRRFWRHRFSEGFTLLIYNDSYRMELSRMRDDMEYQRTHDSNQKAAFLKSALIDSGLMEILKYQMTRVGWADLTGFLYPDSELTRDAEPQHVVNALIEARALVAETSHGTYRTRYDVKNKIAVLVAEVIQENGLSILPSINTAVSAVGEQSKHSNPVESSQDYWVQLPL